VPLVIALAGWWLSEVSTRNQQQIEDQRAQAEQRIEDDRVRGAVLQSYIQDMTELLLVRHLATSALEQPVRHIARSSTLTAIRQLDADRKGVLLQFLHESDLIRETDPIISLNGADLSNANLSGANLSAANLSCFYTFLYQTRIPDPDFVPLLPGSRHICTNLNDADLRGANLIDAT
jgi:uncharacterized protein YjbI with pentapeptide repeats